MMFVTIQFYVSDHILIRLIKTDFNYNYSQNHIQIFRSNYHKNSDRFMYPAFIYW